MKQLFLNRKNLLGLASILILLDQSSKLLAQYFFKSKSIIIVPGLIKYNFVKNYGASFGILSNQSLLLSTISFIVSVVLIILITQNKVFIISRKIALTFLLAGTIGNGLDRWLFGYVTDFIQLLPISFPVFNLADIYINIALIIIIFEYIFSYLGERKTINKHDF